MGDQFINDLSYDEKIVFFKLFCKMIKADGKVDAKEIDFLKMIAARYGIENKVVVDLVHNMSRVDYVSEASKIVNRKHALQLIKELCVLANIDEDIHDTELDILIDVAEAMGIEEDKIIQINRWVLNNIVLAKAGRILLEENNE